jgi:hypothetical protein
MKNRTLSLTLLVSFSATLLAFNASADIITGLQTYWRFDDGSGSSAAVDFTGYGNTGVLTNFADSAYTSMWTTGEVAGAVLFNTNSATSNYVSVASSTNVNFDVSRAFTLAAWVKLSVDGSLQANSAPIICKGVGGLESYTLDMTGGKFRVLMRNNSGNSTATASSVTSPVAGTWYHVVGWWNRNAPRLGIYVNGVSETVNSSATLTTDYVNTHPLTIGCKESSASSGYNIPFQGVIDEVRIYNRVLSDTDVAELYAATNANYAPAILVQPTFGSVNQGGAFTNSPVVMGSQPLSYQWYEDNVARSGQTNASLILNPVQSSDASTNWYVIVTNLYGSTTSSPISLTVNLAPVIAAPISTNVILFSGGKVTLSALASGALPFYYQWTSNNVSITGATNASFILSNAPVGYSASFVCLVSNLVGSATSAPVRVSVIAAPTAPYPRVVLADRPRGYWRLNEPDDNLSDGNPGAIAHDYWNGNDGIYTNTSLGQTGYSQKTDPTDTSALFGPGPDSYAGNIPGVDFGTPAGSNATFSIEAWVNAPAQAISGAGIVSKGYGAGGEQFCLDSQSSVTGFRFFVRDALRQAHNCNSSVLPDGQWHHLVGVCDEANAFLGLYIDGRLAATALTAPIQPGDGDLASTDPMVIGARKSASTSTYYNDQFNGQVDEVAVYDYALTADQILSHYTAAGAPPFITQPPPAAATVNEGGTITLAARVAATPPFTNTWYDVYNTPIAQTVVAGTNFANTSVVVSNVPGGWSGGAVQLAVANAYGSANAMTILTVLSGPPVFVKDLPPKVTTLAGKPYTYSVVASGTLPFSYQWYSNNVALAGQTASSYTFNAATANYSVIVSNINGATNSMISVLTTVPQLTTLYASAILSAGAVGYWPLQETYAPAPATLETNYGTLGAIGNAYYASSNVLFGLGGALASSGGTDGYASFTGGSDSYVFVPRINPALTVRPPFSVECWVFPIDAGFHDLLGQSGSGLNSPGGGGNWAGFRLSQGNPVGGPALQVFLASGTGSTRNSVSTPDGSLPTGVWDYCVATYDGTTVVLYINGQALATNSLPMAIDTWTPFTIGGSMFYSGYPHNRFKSAVEAVAVYTNALSDVQVTSHYLAATTPGSNYYQAVLSGQPTLCYQMNCGSYTASNPLVYPAALNYGSASVNGTYMAGIVPGGVSGPGIPGAETNLAAPINGILSCVDAGNDPAFDPAGATPITAMTWFKGYPADGRVQALMSHGTNWALNLDGATGLVVWNLYGGGQVTSTNVLNDGNWHMVATVSDGTTSSLYVDGVLNNSGGVTGALVSEPTVDLFLGGNADYQNIGAGTQRNLAGAVAQAAYFTNALTALQIKNLYNLATVATAPSISITPSGGHLVITYTGTLLSSTNVAGPYSPVTGASPPTYTVPGTDAQRFYRTHNP